MIKQLIRDVRSYFQKTGFFFVAFDIVCLDKTTKASAVIRNTDTDNTIITWLNSTKNEAEGVLFNNKLYLFNCEDLFD